MVLVAAFTAALLFLHEVVSAYQMSLLRALSRFWSLATGEWVALSVGSFVVEPVLLFVGLYYLSRRLDERLPTVLLLSALAAAVVVGSLFGQFVGWTVWHVPTPFSTALQRNLLYPSPVTLLHWQEFLAPLVRSFLTALAAIGLAQYRTWRR
ncbi:hypothetical protein [Halopelagius longus]|uniref:Uncharacterized protein n=1 Tax=Halopelagius longus TaxID=1236180 RepID=A0A370IJM0_9EURY|nr:hypothetical protein [Halopelagius longus]RDI70893.1 hypothetical protein DWB78_03645 [Halopelagius longus]